MCSWKIDNEDPSVVYWRNQDHSHISHHTGALSTALFDHIIVLIATHRHVIAADTAPTARPMFHDLKFLVATSASARTIARRLKVGTRGNVGSILLVVRSLIHAYDTFSWSFKTIFKFMSMCENIS